MRLARQLAIPVLLTAAVGASAQAPGDPAARLLKLIPAQAQAVVYFRDARSLETKWSRVMGHLGGKTSFLMLKGETGLEPSRLGPGPLAQVAFGPTGAGGTMVWLVPVKDPKALLQGLKATQKAGVWTWSLAGRGKGGAKELSAWFSGSGAGYLIVADSEASLAVFRKPAHTLSVELAPYTAWMAGHDVSMVATRAAVVAAAESMSQSFKPPAAPKAEDEAEKDAPPAAPAAKVMTRLQAKLERWADLARTSVHHALGGLDLSEDGGVTFVAQALLTKDSPLSLELATLPPVAGHPLQGLAPAEFALALGGDWTALADFQSSFLEGLGAAGKVQPATMARLQKSFDIQRGLTRSMAGTCSAPAPGGSLLSGLTTLVRVSDSRAYLASLEESSQAQNLLFQDLGMPGAVTFTPDVLPGMPSCGVTTRLVAKDGDAAQASSRAALAMLFGGDALQMSVGALDDQQVLAVVGPAELLKARLEEVRKAPAELPRSIQAVEPDLGKDHRFALYLDPRGLRDFAQVMAGKGGGEVRLPAIPEVPAAGITLSLDPALLELRGAVKGETLKALATLFQAIGALLPHGQPGGRAEPAH
jgi:hypothetical protein